MSLRWEIDNKVQALKRWFGQRLGNQRHQVAGKPHRVAGNAKPPGGKVTDAPKH